MMIETATSAVIRCMAISLRPAGIAGLVVTHRRTVFVQGSTLSPLESGSYIRSRTRRQTTAERCVT